MAAGSRRRQTTAAGRPRQETVLLERRLAELTGKGVQNPLLAQAGTYLETAPDEALADAIGPDLG